MRALLLVPAAMMAVVAVPTIPATGSADTVQAASAASPTDSCSLRYHQVSQLRYIREVYHRSSVSKRARRKIRRMASCSYSEEAARNMRRLRSRQARAREERVNADECTPFGDWAIPPYIVMRESRGRNVPNSSGSDASGFYQIMRSTWINFGGRVRGVRYEAMAAPKSEQDCVAERIWANGSQHWAATR